MKTYQKKYITTNGTTVLTNGRQELTLHRITINKITTGTITLSDNGGTFGVIAIGATQGDYQYDVACTGKIQIVNSATEDLTVSYE